MLFRHARLQNDFVNRAMFPNKAKMSAPRGIGPDMTLQALSAYFHRPEMEVAKDLGCCLTSLKKLCRSHGIMRWPYRKVRLFTPATRARPWIWPQDSPLCVPDEKIQPVLPRLSLRPSARAADQKSRQKDAEA
jgi:hypothetical protein